MENRVPPPFILCFFLLLSIFLLPQAKAARNLVDSHSAEDKHNNHSPTKEEEHGTQKPSPARGTGTVPTERPPCRGKQPGGPGCGIHPTPITPPKKCKTYPRCRIPPVP